MPNVVSGVSFPDNLSGFQQQLFLFYWGNDLARNPYDHPSLDGSGFKKSERPYDGEGRYEHFWNLVNMCFPELLEKQDWSEKAARAFCENKHTAITGCGGSSKSTTAGAYAFFFLICAPNDSAVLIGSTTIDASKKRIWKNVRQFYTKVLKLCRRLGETVLIGNPRPCIRSSQKDSAHGIYVIAIAKGEKEKGVEALKGFHPPRLLMVIDEADSVSEAVIEVMPNQEIGTIEYQTIWLGNDPSLFNPLGKIMQPEPGKPVTLGHTEWTSTMGFHCLRFDAFDSPNLRDKDKWKGIARQKDIDAIVSRHGANSPQAWIMLRGIHPPEGADDTILSEALFVRNNCQSRDVVWAQSFTMSGLLDPAFGGDRCVFRTMKRGLDTDGKMRALYDEAIEIQIDANDKKNPPEYQIAAKVKSLCQSRGIVPEEFIMDSSGTGRGTASVLQREWSPNIIVCEFGGAPSVMPISDEDPRPANEEYDRKVTELWYSFRVFVEAGMIRGLDAATAVEFCSRRFMVKAKKTAVETKQEMKLRGARSPDLADCSVLGVHLMREKGINATVMTDVKQSTAIGLGEWLRKNDLDASDQTYAVDSELEPLAMEVY